MKITNLITEKIAPLIRDVKIDKLEDIKLKRVKVINSLLSFSSHRDSMRDKHKIKKHKTFQASAETRRKTRKISLDTMAIITDEIEHKDVLNELSEYQPSDIISEKEGEGSPVSKGKSRRAKSPLKRKFKLPNLKLALNKKTKFCGDKFKEFWNNIHGVTPVVKQIRHNSKYLLNHSGNKSYSKYRSGNISPRIHNKSEYKINSKTPQEFSNNIDILNNSISPWERLAIPKFVSPKASTSNSLVYVEEKNRLPTLNNSKINICEAKICKRKNRKIIDPFSDPKLIFI